MQKQKPTKYRLVRNPETGLPEIQGPTKKEQPKQWTTLWWFLAVVAGITLAAILG